MTAILVFGMVGGYITPMAGSSPRTRCLTLKLKRGGQDGKRTAARLSAAPAAHHYGGRLPGPLSLAALLLGSTIRQRLEVQNADTVLLVEFYPDVRAGREDILNGVARLYRLSYGTHPGFEFCLGSLSRDMYPATAWQAQFQMAGGEFRARIDAGECLSALEVAGEAVHMLGSDTDL